MNKKLLALYGLKWNPFSPELPTEALYRTAAIEHFLWRVQQSLIREGGFALISGDPGTGPVALGGARVCRPGDDITIVASAALHRASAAAASVA